MFYLFDEVYDFDIDSYGLIIKFGFFWEVFFKILVIFIFFNVVVEIIDDDVISKYVDNIDFVRVVNLLIDNVTA